MLTALTHLPSPTLQSCELTFLESAPIDMGLALSQHRAYQAMLARHGAKVVVLEENLSLPDSVFVEDPIIVLDEVAIVTPMGVASRRKESEALARYFGAIRPLKHISQPAKLEGGDVLRIGKQLLVGLSPRTNPEGISALEAIVSPYGYTVRAVGVPGCLHLKTGCTALDAHTLLVNPAWVDVSALEGFKLVEVPKEEPFGANVLPLGDTLCMNAAFTQTLALVKNLGYAVDAVDISEFVKAEAGLTCMSVLFEL